MLGLIRQLGCGGTPGKAAAKIANVILAADGSAAAPWQMHHGASRASATQLLTDLRLFDPSAAVQGQTFSYSAVTAAGSRAPVAAALGHTGGNDAGARGSATFCSAASRHPISALQYSRSFSNSAFRWQDDTAATSSASGNAPPVNLNPLQACASTVPLRTALATA